MTTKDFITVYWSKTTFGKKLLKTSYVSDSDLLFLIPNNVKKRHGIPLTRIAKRGRKKREYRKNRKTRIYSFSLFEILEETVEKTLCKEWDNNPFYQQFVEVKNLNLGDQYVVPPRYDASVLNTKPLFKINL